MGQIFGGARVEGLVLSAVESFWRYTSNAYDFCR